jgi:hypothetical protein
VKSALELHISNLERGALESYLAGAVVQPATCRLGAKRAGLRLQHQWKNFIQLSSILTESDSDTFQNRVRWRDSPKRLKRCSTRCSNRFADAAGQCINMNSPWTAEQQIQSFKLLENILDRRDSRPISKRLLAKIITSSDDGPDLLGIVLRHNTHPIDEYFLKIAVLKGGEVVRLVLSYYTNLIISEDVMLEAVQKYDSAVVEVLLTQAKHVEVTERVIKAAAGRRQPNLETVKLLLTRSGELAIMEEILGLAAERDFRDAPITRTLLNHQEMLVTEHLLECALRNQTFTLDVLQVLLSHGLKTPLEMKVSYEAYAAHASNPEVMKILSDFGCSIPTETHTPVAAQIEESAPMPKHETQCCSTCYNLGKGCVFVWEDLCSSAEGGCRFCCVLRDGATRILGSMKDEAQLTTSLNAADGMPFRVMSDRRFAPVRSFSLHMAEGTSLLYCHASHSNRGNAYALMAFPLCIQGVHGLRPLFRR